MGQAEKSGAILMNQGPWGTRGGGDGGSPWGQKPKKPQKDDAPDLDGILREAQDRFRSFGRAPQGAGRHGLGFALFTLFILWMATGLYRVQPSEHAVIMTFGKWTGTKTDAGLGYHLPWPVQTVQKVDVALDRRVMVGFRDDIAGRSGQAGQSDVPFESLMLTGDENIININFVVLWHIGDAGKYLFQIRDPENTIKKVAESAMREIIGRTEIQKALTGARGEIESDTRQLMQQVLDDYHAGVIVSSVQLQRVDPPAQVVDAFDDVQRARADKERLKNEAETYTNDIVPRARGEAQKLLQDAEAYKQAVTAKAEGDAQRFLSVLSAYRESKDVTEKRLYLETMQSILQNSRKIIVGDDKSAPVPYLPLEAVNSAKPAKEKP